MRFDEKARENLDAAERLLPDERGVFDALSNAAASRTYYAAYLAVADCAQRRRRGFTDEYDTYYRHDRLPDDVVRWGLLDEDGGDDLRWLRDLRIKRTTFRIRSSSTRLRRHSRSPEVSSPRYFRRHDERAT